MHEGEAFDKSRTVDIGRGFEAVGREGGATQRLPHRQELVGAFLLLEGEAPDVFGGFGHFFAGFDKLFPCPARSRIGRRRCHACRFEHVLVIIKHLHGGAERRGIDFAVKTCCCNAGGGKAFFVDD